MNHPDSFGGLIRINPPKPPNTPSGLGLSGMNGDSRLRRISTSGSRCRRQRGLCRGHSVVELRGKRVDGVRRGLDGVGINTARRLCLQRIEDVLRLGLDLIDRSGDSGTSSRLGGLRNFRRSRKRNCASLWRPGPILMKRVLGERFGVDLSEVRLGRVLKELGFSHISARPQHPVQDPQAIAAFKKTFPQPSPRR